MSGDKTAHLSKTPALLNILNLRNFDQNVPFCFKLSVKIKGDDAIECSLFDFEIKYFAIQTPNFETFLTLDWMQKGDSGFYHT